MAEPDRRRPVVLYSPGLGTTRSWGTVLIEELASRGCIVVSIDHTYEAFGVDFGGSVARGRPAGSDTPGGLGRPMKVRAEDTRFVLDWLGRSDAARALPAGLNTALDLGRIGMFRHSAGGITAAQALASDRRVRAAVDLDGLNVVSTRRSWPLMDRTLRHGVSRPLLLVSSAATAERPLAKPLTQRSPSVSRRHFPGTGHYSFTDFQALLPQLHRELRLPERPLARLIGRAWPGATLEQQRRVVAGFLARHLSRPD